MMRAGWLVATTVLAGWPLGVRAQDGGQTGEQTVVAEPAAHAQAHVVAGLAKLRQGDGEAAVAELRTALAAKPGSATIATDLGFALGKLGRTREAEANLRKAIELDPKRFYAYANLAELLADSPERFQRAGEIAALLRRGLANVSDNERGKAAVTLALANFQRSVGKLDEARTLLGPLLVLPETVGQRARELQTAIAADEAALALDDWPAPMLTLADRQALRAAESRLREGKASAALEQSSALVVGKPGWAKARLVRGKALEALGRHDEAVAELSLLLQFQPSEAEAWRLLGTILARHGGALESGRAEEALRHALVLEPTWDDLRELRRQVGERRRTNEGETRQPASPPPSSKARELLDEAQRWIDQEAPEMAEVLLAQTLADSPQFVEAVAASFALSGKVPQASLKAIWNDGAALARLATLLLGTRSDATTAALVRPWLDRAVERGAAEGRYGRALLRSREGDRSGALADLQIYVTTYANPTRLDEARMLRSSLLSSEVHGNAAMREARRLLLADRPEAAERTLGGPCHAELAAATLVELGKIRESMGDLAQAVVCHRLAADKDVTPGHDSLLRLSLLAARLPEVQSVALETYLRRARQDGVAVAAWALARIERSRGHAQDAAQLARMFLAESETDNSLRGPAEELVRQVESAAAAARASESVRNTRIMLALTSLAGLALLVWLRARFRGMTLARALARKPDLFPEVARVVAEIRHDLLKHRASALGLAGAAGTSREEISRALREPLPVSKALADLYAQLADRARALGVGLRPLLRQPVLGELARDFTRAEACVRDHDSPGLVDTLLELDHDFREIHAPRLAQLLAEGPRTAMHPNQLAAWIHTVGIELGPEAWTAPAIMVADLALAVPVAEPAMATIVVNLLRNAATAVGGAPEARLLLRVDLDRDVSGRRMVSLLVADSAQNTLSLDDIEQRDSQRGLGIVRDLVRRWGGYMIVREEPAPFVKSIGVAFPAAEARS
jgi:tetratricopeptide (TPR) repeat protein